ncbi:hypothetical protein HLB44_13885 [Aquincola sp. S2]|uniref:Uncharacterized protein n=1 Tax=Pseudaquabacterium terrae TaxID=2732868 RepID=A0ABX2EHJ1_9BURK|nr:hypothetical protein [Aquabacterium terrae]NRF68078.1 hypothetical protein [Aquabacterium terrae]
MPTPREALTEGLSDAVGFVLGALAGWQLGRWLGFDALAPGDWDARAVVGVVFVMLGCGAGKWAAMRWRARRR